jgi:ABC-2 type transport system ATP-binding protein
MAFVTDSRHEDFQAVKIDDHIIKAENLIKRFGNEAAVQDVSFYVTRGSIFGFIGPSGSGKTTTVRLLTGIYSPTAGKATVMGENPLEFSQSTRARMGYMPQLFVLYPNLSVWENLNFAASIYGMSYIRSKRLNQVLDFVELGPHKHKLVRNTSGGMQRRLSLAATLVHKPDLIFMDEPTAGVDPVLRRKFWDHFRNIQEDGRTMFITTQYVNEASYCDLVGIMANGKLLVVDTPNGLRQKAFGGEMVDLRTRDPLTYQDEDRLDGLPFVVKPVMRIGPNSVRLVVDDTGKAIPDLMEWTAGQNMHVENLEEYTPPFDDVFVELVREEPNYE